MFIRVAPVISIKRPATDSAQIILIRQTNSFLLFVCNDRACTCQALSPAARRRAGASMRLIIKYMQSAVRNYLSYHATLPAFYANSKG
ncbi:hypothetical protein HCH_04485 [Hahella chejuensis KCTC 2396]|uniref:Uncharacterized protein n=1 Tax=Hahella chejuensis (strain KCTC 2396) TaxID=349521 RepID=Q2SDT6_HAHCH|nr:hypothetical protein HCH_04485 [Hahella chejuensis KCTC 2396]